MLKPLVIAVTFLVGCIFADEHTHRYKDNEEVVLWMNNVGPYYNRQEVYPYFSLPFCTGPKQAIEHYHETLSEDLLGIDLHHSGIDIRFKQNVPKVEICSIAMNNEKQMAFNYAIDNQFWYEMYIDDLPMWGMVGVEQPQAYIYTHKMIEIGFNGDQIVEVNMTASNKVLLENSGELTFTYSVKFYEKNIKFENRFDKYLDHQFFHHSIHWFSIFNSFMMVIFLVGVVSMILMRTLRKDYQRMNRDDSMDDIEKDLGDDYGWKQVHGDVFRPPTSIMLFSSMLGSGVHLAAVAFVVIGFAINGDFYEERGSLLSMILFVYAATSPLCGFTGGSSYASFGGKRWIHQMVQGALFVPFMVCGVSFLVNLLAWTMSNSRAIPFTTMLAIASLVCFVILPLNLVGVVIGRNSKYGIPNVPLRVNAVPRPIPEKKWYMEQPSIVLLSGLLPFGSIFIEMYFVFTSFWAYKIYYVYGFMFLVFCILLVLTACVGIVAAYFLLNAEDYRWHWTCFYCGSSTAAYVFGYAVYYFFFKTKMYGLFQTVFYFSYMGLLCMLLGLVGGTVGYFAVRKFVYRIYSNVRVD